jgi:Rad3-related DNA helicase
MHLDLSYTPVLLLDWMYSTGFHLQSFVSLFSASYTPLSACLANFEYRWWLPEDKYRAFVVSGTWKLVADVDYSCEFDVRDVLAICYSVQAHE